MAQATKDQKQAIYKLASYKEDIKEEWVQWATNDNSKTSCHDLTYAQAEKILNQGGVKWIDRSNWAYFDKHNKQHNYIMSLLRQVGWITSSERYGVIPDLKRFSEWLKSDKAPIRKKLKAMSSPELQTTINALEGILGKLYK